MDFLPLFFQTVVRQNVYREENNRQKVTVCASHKGKNRPSIFFVEYCDKLAVGASLGFRGGSVVENFHFVYRRTTLNAPNLF